MNNIYKMEFVLLGLTSVLCSIIVLKLLFKLRSSLPWRVNCWFCNNYFWVKFSERNCWNCPKCEQYNGFTKDGDYNKPIFAANEQAHNAPRVFHGSPPKNGLCKMCNINQQLKVAQLANYVPMNDRNFEEEIELYKAQLEKAYKLCNPCKKVVQMKLYREKETLLGTKILETRKSERNQPEKKFTNEKITSLLNKTSMIIGGILLVLVSIDCYKNVIKNKDLSNSITNIKEILTGLLERIISIMKMKVLMTFPTLEKYLTDIPSILFLEMPKDFNKRLQLLGHSSLLIQKSLGGFVCFIQIIGHLWNINKLKHAIAIDFLWSVFVMTSIASRSVDVGPSILSLIKLLSIVAVLLVYRSIKTKATKLAARIPTTPNRMKTFASRTPLLNTTTDREGSISMETDDDESLSKYGVQNFSVSSTEAASPLNNSLLNGRCFTPRSSDSLWLKPTLNSTFCVNSVLTSPSSVSETVFVKPSFNKYQSLVKSDSDSDLDESISSLCISSPKKVKKKGDSVFSLRKFTANPSFVAPTGLGRSRPLISPSKLGLTSSWVAGGYWGGEGERQAPSLGSRSSSQSSGFESQASSATQRNLFSAPPSREESVCGEPALADRFQHCNVNPYIHTQPPQHFCRINSPVYPQMQYNGHVHIPQPRFAQHNVPHRFSQQQYVQNHMFKAPGGTGLIKLPQANSFASR